jgi:hypothetical protein
MKTSLAIAVKKLEPHMPKVWCGYLTPSEVLALVKDGYRLTHDHNHKVDHFQKEMDAGRSGQNWCYFDKVGKTRPARAEKMARAGAKG